MTLTKMERHLLESIRDNEFQDGHLKADIIDNSIWYMTHQDVDTRIIGKDQIAGVMSSLVKKGLAGVQHDHEPICWMTELGWDVLHTPDDGEPIVESVPVEVNINKVIYDAINLTVRVTETHTKASAIESQLRGLINNMPAEMLNQSDDMSKLQDALKVLDKMTRDIPSSIVSRIQSKSTNIESDPRRVK